MMQSKALEGGLVNNKSARFLFEWLFLLTCLLAVGGIAGVSLWTEWRSLGEREAERLSSEAKAVHDDLRRHVIGVDHALGSIRDELGRWNRLEIRQVLLNRRLREFSDALSGIRTMAILDAKGRVVAASRSQLLGGDFSSRSYFQDVLNNPLPDKLYISAPFKTVLDVWAIQLSKAVFSPQGEFAGIVCATLDPGEFRAILASILYAPDMWAAIAHGDGLQFIMEPDREGQEGKNLAQAGSFFSRHVQSGRRSQVLTGLVYATGERRVMALHTFQPPELNVDRPLIIAVGRMESAIYQGFYRRLQIELLVFCLFAALAILSVVYFHQRRLRSEQALSDLSGQLAERDNFYRQIFQVNPAVKLVIDPENGKILDANRAAANYYGYPLEDLVGMDISSINCLPPGAIQHELQRVKAEERLSFNFRHRLASGEIREVEVFSAPVKVDDKSVLYSIIQDVTDKKRVEAELLAKLKEMSAILDNSSVGIAFVYDRVLQWSNQRLWEIFGYSSGHVGKPSTRTFYLSDADFEKLGAEAYPVLKAGQRYIVEKQMLKQSGERIWVRLSGKAISASAPMEGSIWIFEDIDASKAAEAELNSYRTQLELMVEERTCDLAVAKEAAESANRAKTAFLSMASHELRTPMSGILGMIGLAKNKTADDAVLNSLSKADRAARQLLAIINDILDLSRIESDRLTLQQTQFKLGEIRQHVLDALEHSAQEKGLQLNYPEDPSWLEHAYVGDPTRITQILINLVGNAIKFTATGAVDIRVQFDSARESDQARLRFEICDTGIGIQESDCSRIFEPFEQADSGSVRKPEGTGLGLALCKRLVQAMGGEIGVDSRLGQGSVFWFEITVQKYRDSQVGASTHARSAGDLITEKFQGANILLVEDDPLIQEVALSMLEDVGLTVYLAIDGEEAVEAAKAGAFDLILMDMNMPNMNGIEATYKIRLIPEHAKTPIVAMTANAFDDDRDACIRAGMNDHLGKPVTPERLYEVVLQWLAFKHKH